MNDAEADVYVEIFAPLINQKVDDVEKRHLLRLLVKEVECDTRHRAFHVAQRMSNEIFNLSHSDSL
jgi:hypothetical protein